MFGPGGETEDAERSQPTVPNACSHHELATAGGVMSQLTDRGRSGIQAAFDKTTYSSTLKAEKNYKCGGNFFWISLETLSSPGVPINPESVAQLQQKYFSTAAGIYPVDVVIAVADLQFDPMEHRAALHCIAPDEVKIAFVMALAKRINED